MNNKNTIIKILIGLGIAIALLVVYSFIAPKEGTSLSQEGGLSSLLDSSSLGQIEETDTKIANAEILKILGNIQYIELDDDIFSNPVFRKLKDSSSTIPKPLVIGRDNPFLPIGYDIILNTQDQTEDENQTETSDPLGWDDGDFGDFGDLDDLII